MLQSQTIKGIALFMIFASVLVFTVSPASSQVKSRSPGLERYTPSKIEWAALHCNANYQETGNLFKWKITYHGEHNTIVIRCMHLATADREEMNVFMEQKRTAVEQYRTIMGWDWLVIREQFQSL